MTRSPTRPGRGPSEREPRERPAAPLLTYRQSLKLALRPMLAFAAFGGLGLAAFVATGVYCDWNQSRFWEYPVFCSAAFAGAVLGQLVAVTRLRAAFAAPVFFLVSAVTLVVFAGLHTPDELAMPVLFFQVGFLTGFLSIQHRYELFASFLASFGWIGSVMLILNHEGRGAEWARNKAAAWMPVPLALLAGFTITLGVYLAQTHAAHLALWQLLGGSPTQKLAVGKLPGAARLRRRNSLALLGLGALLFAFTALVAPYLWRTGRGDREGATKGAPSDDGGGAPRDLVDGDALSRAIRRFVERAEESSFLLWPILAAALVGRPLRRWFWLQHLRRPFPFGRRAPTESIESLWRYARVALVDSRVPPAASDSPQEVAARLPAGSPARARAEELAEIYDRARHGLGVAPGDVARARELALALYDEVREPLTPAQRFVTWYRAPDPS